MPDTQELLANFVRNASESAFCELVTRYFDLVYSTAVRLVDGDTHRAKDVAQIVFADLARMAGKLSVSTTLGGWLHRHTCFVARTVMRGERRRQAREQQAFEMNTLNDKSDSVLAQVAPMLDDAINELGADDRDAILLRFFERRNLRDVGEALGTTENVAQKRVARALKELGVLLERRGVTLPATVLASGLAASAVTAAPAGMALSVAASVLTSTGTTTGISLTSAKVVGVAKLKLGIVGATVVVGIVTAIFLHNQSKARLPAESRLERQQVNELETAGVDGFSPESPETATNPPNAPPERRIEAPSIAKRVADFIARPPSESAAVKGKTVADNPAVPIQRFFASSGGRVTIKGTSDIHDWQVESSVIGGFFEAGPGFPVEPRGTVQTGPLQARAEAAIPVRSLRSVGKNGLPYNDAMDQIMYESLRGEQNPKIRYRLVEISLKGTLNPNKGYECEAQGELEVAGVTNEITMPVLVLPLGHGKLKISGEISVKMTSFQIDPPTALGLIKTGDDVRLLFDWLVALKGASTIRTESVMAPLILNLPVRAFKGTPKDLQLGPNVEPLSDKPRPPMMVPSGVINIAPGSKLTCSDKNATAAILAKITDGDKATADQSIIFLRKGMQWVQMDFDNLWELFAVVIWHAHNTAKVYHDVIVQVADDPDFKQNARTLFNNDSKNTSGLGSGADREYFESYEGKLINAKGVKARYIRFYSKGSTESALNEYTEIEVYGRQAQ